MGLIMTELFRYVLYLLVEILDYEPFASLVFVIFAFGFFGWVVFNFLRG